MHFMLKPRAQAPLFIPRTKHILSLPLRPASPPVLLLFLIVAFGCSFSGSQPDVAVDDSFFTPEEPPHYRFDGLRVATLNTQFLFDGLGDEGQADFPAKGDPKKAQEHRGRIGDIIRMLDADVVMLQEVENERVVRRLVDESLAELGYEVYFVEGYDTFTGQDVALLSRLPVENIGRTDDRVAVGRPGSSYGVSKNLYARMNLGSVPVTLIGLHFLARPDDRSRKNRREAQAEVIRRLVEQEHALGRAVIVLGDLNDYDRDIPDVAGYRPITNVLSRIKAAGPGPDDDLYNLMADVPQSDRFTAFYDRNSNGSVEQGELSAIDHILVSPSLYARVREVVYAQAYDPALYTDHFPIVVGLDVE